MRKFTKAKIWEKAKKTEIYGEGEKEKMVGVFKKAPGWSFGWGCYSFGECWDFLGCGSQTKRGY